MESSQIPHESSQDVSLHLHTLSFVPAEPPQPPTIRYYYSNVAAKNVCYIYRVVEEFGRFVCYPEARGWPRLTLSSDQELRMNFKLLSEDHVLSVRPDLVTHPGQVRYPDLEELRSAWQVGSDVYFRHCDIRTSGKVVGRFVWRTTDEVSERAAGMARKLRLVLLLQLATNELILSSQVTDLEKFDNSQNREEVYIQGISLISVVATLIANVAYLASVSPIRGTDDTHQGIAIASYFAVPTVFLFFNAFAFYASVLAVVLMTAFIPIYGTAGEWGAIFLSGSVPVVLSLVAFYIAYMVSSWAVLDSWGTSLGITLVGILMVVYVRFWAIELMHGNVDKNLEITTRSNPWDWYKSRLEEGPVIENDIRQSTPAQRMSSGLNAIMSKVHKFFFSPTIWQLSVLGTVPENYKSQKKSKLLFQYFEMNYGKVQ